MHGVGTAAARHLDDLAHVEVRIGRCRTPQRVGLVCQLHEQGIGIRLGVDRDTGDSLVTCCADHTDRDLSSVRDEYLADGHCSSWVPL
ncbi:hypothetical protein SDC9_115589 [bioreactor metagenome]|uniref:Uncharacterized protein n=1 Tax=bioreactor metagenome TaxID=1076179 RepID=A0A645BTK0_9ZZZZ